MRRAARPAAERRSPSRPPGSRSPNDSKSVCSSSRTCRRRREAAPGAPRRECLRAQEFGPARSGPSWRRWVELERSHR
eukprot:6324508-Prymnesium_polylepis.1